MTEKEIEKIAMNLALDEVVVLAPLWASRDNLKVSEVFLDMLDKKGYVVVPKENS